jgi:hypothetical protein
MRKQENSRVNAEKPAILIKLIQRRAVRVARHQFARPETKDGGTACAEVT